MCAVCVRSAATAPGGATGAAMRRGQLGHHRRSEQVRQARAWTWLQCLAEETHAAKRTVHTLRTQCAPTKRPARTCGSPPTLLALRCQACHLVLADCYLQQHHLRGSVSLPVVEPR